ncbi:SLC13 family permease [Tistlia consotensis]|uniref:SLC13 family permease n=1 Tax=Tistlia consotensis TaxID=1321365 RepID=UPI00190E9759|nr:ArsB/NhaD family transporter [Tistlia consotensis]
MIFGLDPAWVATGLLVIIYVFIIAERLNRSIIALLGAGLMIVTGVLNQQQAIKGIDFNTIALLTGMMVLVSIARQSGMFEYLAIRSAKLGRAKPWLMMLILSATTAVLSACLDNVTTVLLIAPVTLAVTRQLGVPPYPFLFAEIMASNIGGTATLIGDPPNIIIGSATGLGFNAFILNVAPVIVLILAVQLVTTHLFWGRKMHAEPQARAAVMALDERAAITDRPLLIYSLIVIGGVLTSFVLAKTLDLEPGTIALFGAAVLMLLHNIEHHREIEKQHEKVTATFGEVDWITIFFFVGLFVVVHGLEVTGVLAYLSKELVRATGGDFALTTYVVLWSSAILSAIVDNIPYVATMIPLIKSMGADFGGPDKLMPLWWALSLGGCLGGNGSLIGASANLTVAGIAERNGIRFGFWAYTKYAFGLMLIHVAMANVYIWLRFLS